MIKKLDKFKKRLDEVNEMLMDPEIGSDNKKMISLAKEQKNLIPIVEIYDKYNQTVSDLSSAKEMLKEEKNIEMQDFIEEEIDKYNSILKELENEIKILLLPKDENDDKNVIIEIRSGAGGEEASLFASVVMRMYFKYAEKKGWKVEILDINETDISGVKEVTFLVRGNGAFKKFKYESGVHRVQRVPETESQGRVHTSTITVAVLPEAEEVDINIDQKDLRIDTYRASGAGGQHVNTTDSAVRITHIPTNIVVQCQNERSQIKNRETAMKMLYARLYDHFQSEKDKEYAQERKDQVGTGDRSERIRTYNFPQGRITDHRIGLTLYTLTEAIEGEIDDIIMNLEMEDQKRKLETQVE